MKPASVSAPSTAVRTAGAVRKKTPTTQARAQKIAAEQPSEAHEQEAEPAQPETAQDEPREEEPTESQPVVQAPAGRLGVLPSRSRAAGRAPKPRSNVR